MDSRVRVAVVDSGARTDHPHLQGASVELGPTITAVGVADAGLPAIDEIGHGTAVAAAIVDLAPHVEVFAVRVFIDGFDCPFEHVLTAIDAALDGRADVVNLSLGTPSLEYADALFDRVRRARSAGVRFVAPATIEGLPSFPGCLDGVDAVVVDPNVSRHHPERRPWQGREFWYASPEPRERDDGAAAANWSGVSFAVANVSAAIARSLLDADEAVVDE